MAEFKAGIRIHHGKLRARLTSVRSVLQYLCFQVYDRGITITPSHVRRLEVIEYLEDTYGDEVKSLRSPLTGKYEADNFLLLEYVGQITTNPNLKKDLELLSAYYRIRDTEDNISHYLSTKDSVKGSREVRPLAFHQYGRVKFRSVNDLSFKDNFYTLGNAKEEFVSGVYYDKMSEYAGFPKDDEWTFRSELTRQEEEKYMQLILEGHVEPNTSKGRQAYEAYLRERRTKGENGIYIETLLQRIERVDGVTQRIREQGLQVKGLTDYSIIYEDAASDITSIPIYVGYYVWDYDNNEPLEDINRLLGIGGEFTREAKHKRTPYMIEMDGELVPMYRVEIEDDYDREDEFIRFLKQEYDDEIRGRTSDEDFHSKALGYCITTDDLSPSGFAYSGESDHVRALNATDLELNGDIVKYDANIQVARSRSARVKEMEQYERLVEGGIDLDISKVRTVMPTSEDMFLKQHLKYYKVDDKGEQVIEGLIFLDKDFQPTRPYKLMGDNEVYPMAEEDLNKQIGVYVYQHSTVYAYRVLLRYDTETRGINLLKDTIIGVDRTPTRVKGVSLMTLGVTEELEENMKQLIRNSLVADLTDCENEKEFYQLLMLKQEGAMDLYLKNRATVI